MNTNALHRKMMAEFLEKIKDWPEDAKRTLKEAIERMLSKPPKTGDRKPSTDDAFGAWVGPETAEEIIEMIYSARTQNPDREPL
jgi:hypothetical protein